MYRIGIIICGVPCWVDVYDVQNGIWHSYVK